jgi:hypothetical protein
MNQIRYTHRLDGQGTCSCGDFAMNVKDPLFPKAAADHFIATTEAAVRDQTGWRGLIYRWKNRRG